jgi:mRNA interferase RelE/StbE
MKYSIILARTAEKELSTLPKEDIRKIAASIDNLELNPRPRGFKKLKGQEDLYRIRTGNFRIVYTVDDNRKVIRVLIIRNRKDVYRQ